MLSDGRCGDSSDEQVGGDWLDDSDPVFAYPFMGGDGESEASVMQPAEWERYESPSQKPITVSVLQEGLRAANSRRHGQDWNQFGGEKSGGSNSSRTPGRMTGTNADAWRDFGTTPAGGQRRTRMGKFNDPGQFPKDIKQALKYDRWCKWKAAFDVALSICDGEPTDQQKVGLLFTYVGDEVRDVISMLHLPPMHGERTLAGAQYTELSAGLNDYFRALVDESTDYARYTSRKQLPGESVHDFAVKLRDLAASVSVGHETVAFRHQFLSGLSNRVLAKKATEEGTARMPISEVIQQAGRIEQAQEAEEAKPWSEQLPTATPMVMELDGRSRPGPVKGPLAGKKRRFGEKSANRQTKW